MKTNSPIISGAIRWYRNPIKNVSGFIAIMGKRPFNHRMRGFTLFEILIAMFIFSVVVTTIFGSYRAVFSSVEPIERGITEYEMATNCLNRMVLDLKSAYAVPRYAYSKPGFDDPPDPYRMAGDSDYTGSGSYSRFRFTSLAHVGMGGGIRDGVAEIVYYVRETEDSGPVLKRSDTLPPFPEFEPRGGDPVLCENVKSLTFTYFDEEGIEHETWNSEAGEFKYATPRAIRIQLETGDETRSLFFETMVDFPVYREKIE